MLKFLGGKKHRDLHCFLPVLNNKTTTEGQMIQEFSESLYLVLIYSYLCVISLTPHEG